MILIIDNYDSFSYNLYQLIGSIDSDVRVVRNDEITVDDIKNLEHLKAVVISPGPGRPEGAGICLEAVKELGPDLPILGVCLGHQAICQAFGGRITYAETLMHGKSSRTILAKDCPLFRGIPDVIDVGRYHSLAAAKESQPGCLRTVAKSEDGEIMAVQHTRYPIFGLQFHPESILTPYGKEIMNNFLKVTR
jgi:anthranilate synthase component II